jgi:membrane-bound lytic murein transglycosylase D
MAKLNLPQIANRPYFATIGTSQMMDIKTAARLAEMPLERFVALNPSHNRPMMKADTPLVIPADKLETFQNNLRTNNAPLSEWQAYTPRSGEKLDRIAPRFGITLNDLRRINGLHGKLKIASSTLLVPSGNGGADLSTFSDAPSLPLIAGPAQSKASSKQQAHAEKPGKKDKHTKAGGKNADKAKAGKTAEKSSAKTSKSNASSSKAKPVKSSAKASSPSKPTKPTKKP